MSDEKTNADGLGFYLCGAAVDGGSQRDTASSFGGFRSSKAMQVLAVRRVNAIENIEVQYMSGENGAGNGALVAATATQLGYTPPGGTKGSLVTIANGETKLIEGLDPDKYVRVKRTSANNLQGNETLQFKDIFRNVIGFPDVTDAEQTAGNVDHAAFFVRNDSAQTITNVFLWLGTVSFPVRVAFETPAGDGSIQTIADKDTAPTGRTWNSGTTQGTGLSLGTLTAGQTVGIWVERTIAAASVAGPRYQTELKYQFDYSAVTYNGVHRGRYRIEDLSIARYELFQAIGGGAPDYTAPAYETFTAFPHATALLPPGFDYQLVLRKRNAFNILTGNTREDTRSAALISVAADSAANPPKPTDAEGIVVTTAASGALRVQAVYNPVQDTTTYEADTFVIWANSDGTDPDPDVDAAVTTVAMSTSFGLRTLDTTFGAYLDNSPMRVVVRTRRTGTPDVDSTDVTVYSATLASVPPPMTRTGAFFGTLAKRLDPATAPTSADDFIVDAGNNIFLRPGAGTVSFYADTALIWRCIYDGGSAENTQLYIPSEFKIDGVTGFAAGGTTDPIDVISWTGLDKRLGINVNGVRVMLIDVTNTVIYYTRRDGVNALTGVPAPTPVWARYTATNFQVWDVETEAWVTYAMFDTSAKWYTLGVRFNHILNQAAIEAL